jgi:hypothetical protein
MRSKEMATKPTAKINRMSYEKCNNTFQKFIGVERQKTRRLQVVNPRAFDVCSSNYSLQRFYNVQDKFTDVSTECAVFIFRLRA